MEIQTLFVGLVCVLIFYLVKRPRVGANEPPFVPYTIPIIGHTYQYLFNSKEFIRNCKEKYGECFSIYVYGKVITVISRNLINDLHKDSQVFDLQEAVSEVLPLHRIFVYNGGLDKENIRFHVKTTREQVSGKLDTNIPIAQKYLLKRIEKWIGDCSEPKTLNSIWFMINDIVALPITNILVGEEAASHEDLVESLRDLAFDLGKLTMIPPIFSFIHKDLHEFIISLPMRFGWNPISRHRKVLMDRIKPVIEKRVEEKKVLGDNYKPYNDLLEYYMNQPDFDHTDLNKLLYYTDNFFAIDFAAITTTSGAATHALFDLAGRPEYVNELYEEALAIDKECNGSPTPAHIKNMVKLDSFLKESLRLSRDTVSTGHCLISKGYTFSNGSTIPKGRKVTMYIDDSLKSKEAFGNDAEDFKPFRFVNGNSPATKVDRSYVVFGGGKHACPGRFFAVNEIKLVLHKLILRYEISTKSGKVEEKLILGSNILPPQGALVFKNRK